MVEPEALRINDPVSGIAKWLDIVDQLGPQVPLQVLTTKDLPHPLEQNLPNLDNHQSNLQLGVIILDILNDPLYFQSDQAMTLISELQGQAYLKDVNSNTSPQTAVKNLINKQASYLPKGESWQFGKVGLEINPHAQRIAYKLHALQELLEPFAAAGAKKYEDQLADIFTKTILHRADQFKLLAQAIGPYRGSVRWMDFLPGAENQNLFEWIQRSKAFGERQEIPEILLSIIVGKSTIWEVSKMVDREANADKLREILKRMEHG